MDGERGLRHLELIERPGGRLEVFCPWCRRVVFVMGAGEPDPVERLRLVEPSHAVNCPGDRDN
jgi:hypothetical protein